MKCYKLHFVHRDGILFYIERVSEKVGLFCGKLCYFLMVDKLNIDIDRKANGREELSIISGCKFCTLS